MYWKSGQLEVHCTAVHTLTHDCQLSTVNHPQGASLSITHFPSSCKRIQQPVVQPVWPALPEFNGDGPYQVSAPMGRARNFSIGEYFSLSLAARLIKPFAAFNHFTLRGSPGANTAAGRAALKYSHFLFHPVFQPGLLSGPVVPVLSRKKQGMLSDFPPIVSLKTLYCVKTETPCIKSFE